MQDRNESGLRRSRPDERFEPKQNCRREAVLVGPTKMYLRLDFHEEPVSVHRAPVDDRGAVAFDRSGGIGEHPYAHLETHRGASVDSLEQEPREVDGDPVGRLGVRGRGTQPSQGMGTQTAIDIETRLLAEAVAQPPEELLGGPQQRRTECKLAVAAHSDEWIGNRRQARAAIEGDARIRAISREESEKSPNRSLFTGIRSDRIGRALVDDAAEHQGHPPFRARETQVESESEEGIDTCRLGKPHSGAQANARLVAPFVDPLVHKESIEALRDRRHRTPRLPMVRVERGGRLVVVGDQWIFEICGYTRRGNRDRDYEDDGTVNRKPLLSLVRHALVYLLNKTRPSVSETSARVLCELRA